MDRLQRQAAGIAAYRTIAPVVFESESRLTFKRLRRPTRLPTLNLLTGFSGYLARLNWLFVGR